MGKRVFSLETERDKDLRVLAWTQAKCRQKLAYKDCHPDECPNCPTLFNYCVCYKELPACDKLRVDGEASEIYSRLIYFRSPEEIDREKRKEAGLLTAEEKAEERREKLKNILGYGSIAAAVLFAPVLMIVIWISSWF